MAAGLHTAGLESRELPLADGGEGTLDVLVGACGGARHRARVTGPLGAHVEAPWAMLGDGTAVIEAAAAAGLALVGDRRDPMGATTRGVGELLRVAAGHGATRAVVCVGGSASTDGGLGAVEALDWSLGGLEVTVLCDVRTGFVDAAARFGPQKGAGPAQVALLTARLEGLAGRYRETTGVDVAALPGAGAAGGLAGGLAALGASLRPGIDAVADAVGLDEALADADVVVTGEGRLDATSFEGKVVGAVLERRPPGLAAALIVGEATPEGCAAVSGDVVLRSLVERAPSREAALSSARELLTDAAADAGRLLRLRA
jgi:glycerate kinase